MHEKHFFVCCNTREEGDGPTKGCGSMGGIELEKFLKDEIKSRKLNKKIRVNKAGCLGKCRVGPCAVLYPSGEWYAGEKLLPNRERVLHEVLLKGESLDECRITLEDLMKQKKERKPENNV